MRLLVLTFALCAPPSVNDADLAKADKDYEAAQAKAATEYSEALTAAIQGRLNVYQLRLDEATKAGDLAKAVAIDQEMNRMRAGRTRELWYRSPASHVFQRLHNGDWIYIDGGHPRGLYEEGKTTPEHIELEGRTEVIRLTATEALTFRRGSEKGRPLASGGWVDIQRPAVNVPAQP